MRPTDLPRALLVFLGFVATVPIYMHYLDQYFGQLRPESQFIATLILPAMAILFVAGWVTGGPA